MDSEGINPPDGFRDAIGRGFNKWNGFDSDRTDIQVGARVRLLADPNLANLSGTIPSLTARHFYVAQRAGREATVVGLLCARANEPRKVLVRYTAEAGVQDADVSPDEWEVAWTQVLEEGGNSVQAVISGMGANLDKRFAGLDHRYRGWNNLPTYRIVKWLKGNQAHTMALASRARWGGPIDALWLRSYCDHNKVVLSDDYHYQAGLPPDERYRLEVDWEQAAAHLEAYFGDPLRKAS